MIPSSRPKPPTLLGCTSIRPNMQRCSAWMKKRRFRRWIVKTWCCRSPRAEPSVTALSTTVMARFRFLPLSTPARAMSWAKPLSATLRRSSWPSSLTSWPINPSVKRSTSSPIISPPTKPRRWRNSLLVIPTFICILPRRIPPGSIKSNCGSPRYSAMSSREGFSPRSRTWIKNSCATSVNTTKNPKPLNGSTSIQPVESLANQLLQLTSFNDFRNCVVGQHDLTFPCSRTVKLRVHLAQRRLVVGSLGRQRRRHLQEARPRCQYHLYRRHAEGADVALRGRAASRRRHGPRGGERKSARRRRFDDHGF